MFRVLGGSCSKTSALRPSNDGVRRGHIEWVKVNENPSLLPGKNSLETTSLGKTTWRKNMGDIQIIHIQNDGEISGHQKDGHQKAAFLSQVCHWMVVSNIFYFHPYLGK